MIPGLPFYINFIFFASVFLTAVFFYFAAASEYSRKTVVVMLIFLTVQGVLGITEFFTDTDTLPPRFILLAPPVLIFLFGLFFLKEGKKFIEDLDPKFLTYLHSVRVPVEIVLFLLYVNNMVPEIMTFEGNNFDILAGITAPFAAYFGYRKNSIRKTGLLIWNFICLGLLLNIVLTAVLSVPSQIQLIAFDQPNVGVLYFPFVWLPGFIVPLVLFSHIVCIKKLLIK